MEEVQKPQFQNTLNQAKQDEKQNVSDADTYKQPIPGKATPSQPESGSEVAEYSQPSEENEFAKYLPEAET